MAVTSYSTLSSAITDWAERPDWTSTNTDELIALAEAEFRLYFGPNFAKETTATVSFTSGSGTIPTGLVRVLSLTHSTYGQMKESTIAAVREQRIWDASGVPMIYCLFGSTIELGPSYDGNLTLDYEGTLTGLSASNTTNWLVTYAPQAYLSMCLSFGKARMEDYQGAALLKQAALRTLDDLGMQSVVAQRGRASVRIPGSTP